MYIVLYVFTFHVFGLVSLKLYGLGSPVWFSHTLAEYVGVELVLRIWESLLYVRRMVAYVVYLCRYGLLYVDRLGFHILDDSGNQSSFVLRYPGAKNTSFPWILSVVV